MRALIALGFLAVATPRLSTGAAPPPELEVAQLPSPKPEGRDGFILSAAASGSVTLFWSTTQRSAGAEPSSFQVLESATLERGSGAWRRNPRALEILAGDARAVAADDAGRLTAAWGVNGGLRETGRGLQPFIFGVYAESTDGGAKWTPPLRFTDESARIDSVSVAAIDPENTAIAWRDSRIEGGRRGAPPPAQRIGVRVVTPGKPDEPGEFVDRSGRNLEIAEQLGPPAVVGFPDGTALVAHIAPGVGHLKLNRFADGRWSLEETLPASRDPALGWVRMAARSTLMNLLWPVDARTMRLLTSNETGLAFQNDVRIATVGSGPIAEAVPLVLRDGSSVVMWTENDRPGVFLRTIARDGTVSEPREIGGSFNRISGLQAVVVGDTSSEAAQLLAAGLGAGGETRVVRITLNRTRPAANDAAADDCGCGDAAGPEGLPIRVRVVSVDAAAGTVRAEHFGVADTFEPGTRDFRIGTELVKTLRPAMQAFGRVAQRDGAWWLFDVRILGAPFESQ